MMIMIDVRSSRVCWCSDPSALYGQSTVLTRPWSMNYWGSGAWPDLPQGEGVSGLGWHELHRDSHWIFIVK